MPQIANKSLQLMRHDYSSTNVTTSAYVELDAALDADTKSVDIFDSSGETMILAYGPAGGEEDLMYIMPGGNGRADILIPKGVRLAVKAASGNATAGELTINFWG